MERVGFNKVFKSVGNFNFKWTLVPFILLMFSGCGLDNVKNTRSERIEISSGKTFKENRRIGRKIVGDVEGSGLFEKIQKKMPELSWSTITNNINVHNFANQKEERVYVMCVIKLPGKQNEIAMNICMSEIKRAIANVTSVHITSKSNIKNGEEGGTQSCKAYSSSEMEQGVLNLTKGGVDQEQEKQAKFLAKCLAGNLSSYVPDMTVLKHALLLEYMDPTNLLLPANKQEIIYRKLSLAKKNASPQVRNEIEVLSSFLKYVFNRFDIHTKRLKPITENRIALLNAVIDKNKEVNDGLIKYDFVCTVYLHLANYYLSRPDGKKKAFDTYTEAFKYSDKKSKHGIGCYGRAGVSAIGIDNYISDELFSTQEKMSIFNAFYDFIDSKNRKVIITDAVLMEAYAIQADDLANQGQIEKSQKLLNQFNRLQTKTPQGYRNYLIKWFFYDHYFYSQLALGEVEKAYSYYQDHQLDILKKTQSLELESEILYSLANPVFNKFIDKLKKAKLDGFWVQNNETRKNLNLDSLLNMYSKVVQRFSKIRRKDTAFQFSYVQTIQMYTTLLNDNPKKFKKISDSCIESASRFQSKQALFRCNFFTAILTCRYRNFSSTKNIRHFYNEALKYVDQKRPNTVEKDLRQACKDLV